MRGLLTRLLPRARTKSRNLVSEYTIPRQIYVYKQLRRGFPRGIESSIVTECLCGDTESRFAGENRTDLLR